jgi:hypothetical protein
MKSENVDVERLFEQYVAAYEATDIAVEYLAPIELVSFEQDSMAFSDFEICRFSSSELHEILQLDIIRLFYPSWMEFDANRLADYWFIRARESFPRCCDPHNQFTVDPSGVGAAG